MIDAATSEVVERASHQAFGAIESDFRPDRWSAQREQYKFTGKEEDLEVGLTYFGARYYHARLNRWISPDPLTIHGLGADLNPYAYVRGRALASIDPFGLDDVGPPVGVGQTEQYGTGNMERTGESSWEIRDPAATPGASNVSAAFDYGQGIADSVGLGSPAAAVGTAKDAFVGQVANSPIVHAIQAGQAVRNGGVRAVGQMATGVLRSHGDWLGAPFKPASRLMGPPSSEAEELGMKLDGHRRALGTALAGAVVAAAAGAAPEAAGFPGWPTIGETPGGAIGQSTSVSCGAACGEMVAGVPQAKILPSLGKKGIDAASLAKELGSDWRGGYVNSPQPLQALNSLGRPWIAQMKGAQGLHYVVVDGRNGSNLLIRDPWAGGSTYEMTENAFNAVWTGTAVFR